MSQIRVGKNKVIIVGLLQGFGRIHDLLDRLGCTWECLASAPAALRCLRDHPDTDLLLMTPGLSQKTQNELCRAIKYDARSNFVAVVFLHPPGHESFAVEAFEAGADDYVSLDAPIRELEARLLRALRCKHATDSLEDSATVILALASAIEGKDEYTCGHVERVGTYSVEIGKRLGLGAEDLSALRTGGVVHDIGKVGIPDQVLNKPGRLTDEEMAIMRRHPVIGYDILKPLRTFRNVLPIVRWHHERPNGTGYPDGLSGDHIPLLPRITAVADVFDAISTDRPYRKAFPLEKCHAIMREEATHDNLDASLVESLFDSLATSPMAASTTPVPAAV